MVSSAWLLPNYNLMTQGALCQVPHPSQIILPRSLISSLTFPHHYAEYHPNAMTLVSLHCQVGHDWLAGTLVVYPSRGKSSIQVSPRVEMEIGRPVPMLALGPIRNFPYLNMEFCKATGSTLNSLQESEKLCVLYLDQRLQSDLTFGLLSPHRGPLAVSITEGHGSYTTINEYSIPGTPTQTSSHWPGI